MPARIPTPTPPSMQRQRGVALMIFLVIMVLGALTLFVNSLVSSTNAVHIARDKTTADALAQAKAALIGYSVSHSSYPGELPCPDVDDDGKLTMGVDYSGSSCTSPIGRLPWKTLGIPELRDGSGEHLWYAVSKNFWAMGTPTINSDTPAADLAITDSTSSTITSNIVAIVFAPGLPLPTQNQDRSASTVTCSSSGGSSTTANLCADNYLEGNNASAHTVASPNPTNYQSASSSSSFNDQLIYITRDQLLSPVEMRIVHEVKKCLDDYATNDGGKYPWAGDSSNSGTYNTLFGWFPNTPNTDTSSGGSTYSDPSAQTLADALNALQAALDAYNTSPTATNQSALISAANTVIGLKSSVSGVSSTTIDTAGDNARYYANGIASYTYATASAQVTSTFTALDSVYPPTGASPDGAMPNTSWSTVSTCNALINGSYWPSWKNFVFYQIANGYQPGGSASCTSGSTCLTINGSGNTAAGNGTYRAAVILARQALAGQSRSSSNVSDYLEDNNVHTATGPSTTFETYKSSDTSYSTVNDLVVCVDGNNNCR